MSWFSTVVRRSREVIRWRRRPRSHDTPPLVPVPAEQLPTVAAVIERLRALQDDLPDPDGVREFNRMYLRVTEVVDQRIRGGYFHHPEFLTRLDIVFAQLYLDAVAAWPLGPERVARCWAPVFESRGAPLVPIQFAVAGMNAHINHDLPVAVVATCGQLGLTPTSPGVREDYDRVTQVLAEVNEEVRQSFLQGWALAVDREVSPVLTLIGSWSIGRARDAAWVNTEVLWRLRESPELQAQFRNTLSSSVGMAGRTLLTPVQQVA